MEAWERYAACESAIMRVGGAVEEIADVPELDDVRGALQYALEDLEKIRKQLEKEKEAEAYRENERSIPKYCF